MSKEKRKKATNELIDHVKKVHENPSWAIGSPRDRFYKEIGTIIGFFYLLWHFIKWLSHL